MRQTTLKTFALLAALSGMLLPVSAPAQTATAGGLLPSWNDGAAKQAIFDLVRATIDRSSPNYVFPEDRIAVFDQDGTLWVEHPMYTQVVYCLERVPAVVAKKPELRNVEPFKTVLSGNRETMAKLPMRDLEKILAATLTGMTVDEFNAEARKWLETAKHPRWNRPYTEMVYQPMLEVLSYLRNNAYKTYIVTGGGQDFVRVYAEKVYGIPPEQVIGTAGGTKYGYGKDGTPFLTKEPKLILNDNDAGKVEGIHLMIGRRPYAAFGNSTGDRQMLEWTGAGGGARLKMLVLHDDAAREYAYGPAAGLPDSKVGTFTPGALRRGQEERLDGDQHEERLEAHFCVRAVSWDRAGVVPLGASPRRSGHEHPLSPVARRSSARRSQTGPAMPAPCTHEIDRMQARVDAMIAAMAAAGPAGRESGAATRHRQPTPDSIAAAEEKLGEGARAERALAALAQARAADRAGDQSACERVPLADCATDRAIGSVGCHLA